MKSRETTTLDIVFVVTVLWFDLVSLRSRYSVAEFIDP
jgi:hypothetical protein